MKEMWLAIDGGGSRTRILLADTEGNVCAKEVGGPASGLYIDRARHAREITGLLKRIKHAAKGLGGRVSTVGLAGPMDAALVKGAVRGVFGTVTFVAAQEGEIALALYGLKRGITLVAGTGSSCRAFNEEGRWIMCGGFGPQFGDEGSGHWIGRSAITAVMLAGNGRGPHTALDEKLNAFLGVSRIWEIYRFVDRSGHISGTQIAAFTPHVFDAAREGDAVARRICQRAGRCVLRRRAVIRPSAALDMARLNREIGKGTTFKVYLPIVERAASKIGSKFKARPMGGSETILLAEDDPAVLGLTSQILEDAGYTVLQAVNGREAVSVFRENVGNIALILADVVMPELGGKGIYDALSPDYPDLRFLFLSGYTANAVHTGFVLHEHVDLIQKPFAPAALLCKVREILDKPRAETRHP